MKWIALILLPIWAFADSKQEDYSFACKKTYERVLTDKKELSLEIITRRANIMCNIMTKGLTERGKWGEVTNPVQDACVDVVGHIEMDKRARGKLVGTYCI